MKASLKGYILYHSIYMTFWGEKSIGAEIRSELSGVEETRVDYKDIGEIFGVMELFYIVIVVVDNYNLFVQIHRTVW